MSDLKITRLHCDAVLLAAIEEENNDEAPPPFLREVETFLQRLASGELRCADTKTEVVVSRKTAEALAALVEKHRERDDAFDEILRTLREAP